MNIKLIVGKYFFFSLMIILIGCNSSDNYNELKKTNLNGNVKSIKVLSFKGIEKFGEMGKGVKDQHPLEEKDMLILFNTNGNMTERSEFNSDGGLKIKSVFINDKEKKNIEEGLYNSEGELRAKYFMTYDETGNLIEIKWYSSDGEFQVKIIYKYDDKRNKIGDFWMSENDELHAKYIYYYDDIGNNIKSESYKTSDTPLTIFNYKYDEFGNILEKDEYSVGYESRIITNYKYEYDFNDNWIVKIVYSNYGDILIEREIEYYN